MRDRLIAWFVGFTVLLVGILGIVRAYYVADLVGQAEIRKVERSVVLVAKLIAERETNHEPITATYLADLLNHDERLVYVRPDGRRIGAASPDWDARQELTVRAGEVATGGRVTLSRPSSLIDGRISEAMLRLVVVGLIMMTVASAVGWFAARRLSRPFQELAAAARRLGRGRFDITLAHYSIPEAEAIGQAMQHSAGQLQELVRREREFAANASHQLRTPITALRLGLEDLSMWPETPATVASELGRALRELDRLSGTVSDLLELARGKRIGSGVEIDLSAVIGDAVERWAPRVRAAGRDIVLLSPGPVPVRLAPGPIEQVLDILIENALHHGVGDVTVDVSRLERHLRVRVRDQGTERIADDVFARHVNRPHSSGEGIGLAVGLEIADALGGYLTLDPAPVTTFSLMLPHAQAVGTPRVEHADAALT